MSGAATGGASCPDRFRGLALSWRSPAGFVACAVRGGSPMHRHMAAAWPGPGRLRRGGRRTPRIGAGRGVTRACRQPAGVSGPTPGSATSSRRRHTVRPALRRPARPARTPPHGPLPTRGPANPRRSRRQERPPPGHRARLSPGRHPGRPPSHRNRPRPRQARHPPRVAPSGGAVRAPCRVDGAIRFLVAGVGNHSVIRRTGSGADRVFGEPVVVRNPSALSVIPMAERIGVMVGRPRGKRPARGFGVMSAAGAGDFCPIGLPGIVRNRPDGGPVISFS